MSASTSRRRSARHHAGVRLGAESLERRAYLAVSPGPEFRVNTFTTYDQLNPATAMDSAGDSVIVWQSAQQEDPTSNAFGVFAQRYGADGAPQGSEFRVNTTVPSNQTDPAVAMDPAGDFVVAWESPDGTSSENGIFVQRFNAAGVKQGPEFRANTHTAGMQARPAVAIDPAGDFVIAWQSGGQDNPPESSYGVYAQRFNAAGAPQGGEFRVNSFVNDTQYNPTVAMDAAGDFVIAWGSIHQLPVAQSSVYAQRYDAAGTPQGGEFRVPSFKDGNQGFPSAAMDAAGDFVIAWDGNGQKTATAAGNGIYAQRFSLNGARQGGEFRANTMLNGAPERPAVAMDTDGDFVVTWQTQPVNGATTPTGIWGQRFTSAGALDGGEFQASDFPPGGQTLPAVAMDATGDFVVAWNSYGQDSTATVRKGGVYGRLYSQPHAPRVTRVYVSGSSWTPAFKTYLQGQGLGSSQFGFAIGGGAEELKTLPWPNINEVSIAFDREVTASKSQLTVHGSNLIYLPSTYSYDAASHTATWTVLGNVANDKILLNLDGDAGTGVSGGGQTLDGDWSTGGAFPSGNGTAGGDFKFRLNVLPGDVNRSGSVLADDFSAVKARFFRSTTSPGSGAHAYSVFHDVDGSGSILADDFSAVKAKFFTSLPGPEPVGFASTTSSAVRRVPGARSIFA